MTQWDAKRGCDFLDEVPQYLKDISSSMKQMSRLMEEKEMEETPSFVKALEDLTEIVRNQAIEIERLKQKVSILVEMVEMNNR